MSSRLRQACIATRATPDYSGFAQLVFGTTARASTHRIKHYAIWNAVLTSQDRTDLVANPLAYEGGALLSLLGGDPIKSLVGRGGLV